MNISSEGKCSRVALSPWQGEMHSPSWQPVLVVMWGCRGGILLQSWGLWGRKVPSLAVLRAGIGSVTLTSFS